MNNWLKENWKGLLAVLAPIPFLLLAGALFLSRCVDGWCPGASQGFFGTLALAGVVVLSSFIGLRRIGATQTGAGWGAWVGTSGLGGLFFAVSQFREGDSTGGLVVMGLSTLLILAGLVLGRPAE